MTPSGRSAAGDHRDTTADLDRLQQVLFSPRARALRSRACD
ncbi:MAG: hypothetical protein ABSC94_28265 [Polyangiaceae bacterium]